MSSLLSNEEAEKRMRNLVKLEPYMTQLQLGVIEKRKELTRLLLIKKKKKKLNDKRKANAVVDNAVTVDTNKARSNTDVLRLVLRDLGWKECQRRGQACDITWHAISYYDQPGIDAGQINKFPGSGKIFTKVNTFRWLEFMKTVSPAKYNFFPRTWLLPFQFEEFVIAVQSANETKSKHKPVYIVKPSEGSQGQGIYLIDDPFSYAGYNNKSHVVQEYLSNVFLIDKYKFDLRVYVVLKSLDPLQFYICREGLARLSTVPYEQPNNKNLHEIYMHLTNYSLNKKSTDFKISDKDDEGSKRKMSAVFKKMAKLGHDVDALWCRIEHLVTLTLIAVSGEMKVQYQAALPSRSLGPSCFQVLGFDIILMNNLHPMLLEVNSNPSLSIYEERETSEGCVDYVISMKDEEVKRALIRDTLKLVAPKDKYTRSRHKRQRHDRLKSNTKENMDNESLSSENSRQSYTNPRRETGMAVKHIDYDSAEKDKSMFYQLDKGKRLVKAEPSAFLSERQGDVISSLQKSSANSKRSEASVDSQTDEIRSIKSWFNKLKEKAEVAKNGSGNNGSLPAVITKNYSICDDVPMREIDVAKNVQNKIRNGSSQHDLANDNVDDNVDSEKENNNVENSCLKEIFPAIYGERFTNERIVEKLADIFLMCLGIKGCMRLTPSMLRHFARRCHLHRKGISTADIDILYIEMDRKFDYMNQERAFGLNFFAFVTACCKISKEVFQGSSSKMQLNAFIDHCQNCLKNSTEKSVDFIERINTNVDIVGRSREIAWKLLLDDVIPRTRGSTTDFHRIKNVHDLYRDGRFPVLHNDQRNIFHILQGKK